MSTRGHLWVLGIIVLVLLAAACRSRSNFDGGGGGQQKTSVGGAAGAAVDGNTAATTDASTVGAGGSLMGAPGATSGTSSAVVCGDGVPEIDEECDDANTEHGDGCNASCEVEDGWSCNDSVPSACAGVCGDGQLVGREALAGGCDDGNLKAGDGCNGQCEVESRWFCSEEPSVCVETCGNGDTEGSEECDDGNLKAGDGCLACAVEDGWDCGGQPSTCMDIDECATGRDTCHVQAICTNATGSFLCECESGYQGDGVSCTDINECTTGAHDCHPNATCSNTQGGFTCTCNEGYSGSGTSCTDIDECTTGTHDCHSNATCSNTQGGFTCTCDEGYSGSGTSCTDIDECTTGADDCHAKATCTNTPGGFTCACSTGYAGNGATCSPVVVGVAAGDNHTCVIIGEGSVRCWGWGNNGRLGYGNVTTIGDDEDPASAGDVDVGGNVQQIVAGGSHTCALLKSGAVRCWGFNYSGQLGYGHTEDIGDDETPASEGNVNVGGTVEQLSAGTSQTCALLSTGRVRCWGLNQNGELGYGHTNNIGDNESPASAGDIDLGGNAVQVTSGYGFNCAVLADGALRCWGTGGAKLGYGDGSTEPIGDDESPSSAGDVPVGASVAQVDLGGFVHACARLANGNVRCWGSAGWGNLGYGNLEDIGDDETPASAGSVNVGGTSAQIAIGWYHSCSLLTTGAVRCWGYNPSGQLGYGHTNTIGDNELPSLAGDIAIGGPAAQISTTASHTCALLMTGRVRCWGLNNNGQLGYGHTNPIGDNELPSSVGDVNVLP